MSFGFSSSAQVANTSLPKCFPGLQYWIDRQFMLPSSGASVLLTKATDRSGHKGSPTITTVDVADGVFKNGTLPGFFFTAGTSNLNFGSFTLGTALTFFVVLQFSPAGVATNLFSDHTTAGNTYISINSSGNVVASDGTNTATSAGALTSGSISTIAITVPGAASSASLYLNGNLDTTTGSLSTSGKTFDSFGNLTAAVNGSSNRFAEAIYYNQALSSTQITQLHQYAREKWFNNA